MNRSVTVGLLGVVAGVACSVFVVTLGQALWIAPESELSVPAAAAYALSEAPPPTRLEIPSLGIDAAVQEVGITKKGTMGVPRGYDEAGWYKYGAAPGELGSAVLAGHLDNG